jgi:hypothetical protein
VWPFRPRALSFSSSAERGQPAEWGDERTDRREGRGGGRMKTGMGRGNKK